MRILSCSCKSRYIISLKIDYDCITVFHILKAIMVNSTPKILCKIPVGVTFRRKQLRQTKMMQ